MITQHPQIKPGKIQVLRLFSFATLLLASSWSFAAPSNPGSQTVTPADPAYVIKTALSKITTFSSNSDKINPVKLRGFIDRKSTRLNSSHVALSRMPSSAGKKKKKRMSKLRA